MSDKRPITFDRVIRVITSIILIGVAIWFIDILQNVLLPFCMACLISYLLEPIVEFQQKQLKLKYRIVPVLLTLVEVTVLIGALVYFCMPYILEEINQIDMIVKRTSPEKMAESLLPADVYQYFRNYLSIEHFSKYFSGTRIEAVLNQSTTVLTATIDFLMHTIEWLLTFIYIIFILLDYKHLMRSFRLAVPPKYRDKTYPILDDIKNNMDRYFRSQAVIALCAAVFYCIGFYIVGLPMAIIMGLMVGILYMIPYFQYVTLIPVIILCYIYSLTGACEFWPEVGKCILVYVISQCICDYLLTPKIMGRSLGMNPAIILLSLSIWGTLLGVIGMIIALPVTALMIGYYKQYVLGADKKMDLKSKDRIGDIPDNHTP